MIVITSWQNLNYTLSPGDSFVLSIKEHDKVINVIREEITSYREVNFACSFRFCDDSGRISGFHLAGIFGNTEDMPDEIRNAIRLEDLSELQSINFINSLTTN